MVGPILNLELTLGSRRGRHFIFRWVYAGWLLVTSAGCLFFHWALADAGVLHSFTAFLIYQQFLLILLVTPAFTAGAITDEKGRGSLQDLLTAGLTSWEIVAGKLLARVTQVAVLLLTGLPVLCFFGVFGGLDPLLLLALVLVSALALFALAAGSVLASVWTVETRTAVLGVYAAATVGFGLLLAVGLADYFDPGYVLEPAWGGDNAAEFGRRFLVACLAWGSVGGLCLALAVGQMRPAYLRQIEGGARKKERRRPARRPPPGDDPVRWRERHVAGIAPLPVLRALPRGCGYAAVFGLSLLGSTAALVVNLPAGVGPNDLARMAWRRDFGGIVEVLRDLNNPSDEFLLQSLIVVAVATLVVGIRCSGAVSGERERRTWEALLLTPLETRQLIRSKLWSILGAAWPYLIFYALPAIPLALVGGFWCLLVTVVYLGVTLLGTFFVGCAGLWCSVRARSSWRSLVGTLAFTYLGGTVVGSFLSCVIGFLAAIILMIIQSILELLNRIAGAPVAPAVSGGRAYGYCFAITAAVLLAGIAFGVSWYFLVDAELWVANRERTRPWKDAARVLRRRRGPTALARPFR